MENDLLTYLVQKLSKIVITEKEGVDHEGNLTGKNYVYYNGFIFANEFSICLAQHCNDYLDYLENHLYSISRKFAAIRFLRKIQQKFNRLKSDFNEIRIDELTGTYDFEVNRNIEDQRDREKADSSNVYHNPVVMEISMIQLNTIYKILDFLNTNIKEIMLIPELDWNEVRKSKSSIPVLVVDEKYNLNEEAKSFDVRLNKYQAVLLYSHLERMKCILPYDHNRSKGKILHLLTGHSVNKLSELISPATCILNRDFPSIRELDEAIQNHQELITLLEDLIKQIEEDKRKIEEIKL